MGGEEGLGVTTGQPNLYKQDLSKLDVSKLTALSREVISRQATINIGTIGHVAHGKSTIVKAISGVQTVRFKNELERNITIKLDARAAEEDSSGELADATGGYTSKMPQLANAKRPPQSGVTQRRVKQLKIGENLISSEVEIDDVESVISSAASTTSRSSRGSTARKNRRLNVSDRADDKDSGIKYNLKGMKLKELRITLEDIGYKNRKDIADKFPPQHGLWEVETILGKKEENGVPVYRIKWKNWDSKYNTWEPTANLINCTDILEEFEESRRLQLENFKEKTSFYPDIRDVEEFLADIKYQGETVDCAPVDEDKLHTAIRSYAKTAMSTRSRLETSIKRDIVRSALINVRREQLESLQDWEDEMNNFAKGKPVITVENLVDLEGAPQDFFYIDDYLPGAGVIVPDDPPIGCECVSCDAKTKCCFKQNDGFFPYTPANRIRVPPGTPIYECNKRCSCGIDCPMRVVQRGTNAKLCIFRTSNGRGWGVKTLRSIKKGTFVTEYVGEVITSDEAEKRGKEYDAAGRTYLFDLDYNEVEGQCPYTVDAAMYGNVSHFINHSCDPNLAVYGVWINCLDPNLPKLALFAKRDIKKNEEITFDYMCQISKNNEKPMKHHMTIEGDLTISAEEYSQKFDILPDTPESDTTNNKTLCKCGALTCRRYLF